MFVKLNSTKPLFVTLLFALFSLTLSHAQVGSQDAGALACPAPTAAAPVWSKLVLSGNVVTCYYARGAATPKTWTQIGQPQTLGFIKSSCLVGMYITSHTGTALSTGTIDNFSISPAPAYRLTDCDIGAPSLMGSANLISNVWNLAGSGADIWGSGDQFNFQPWLVWGDCTIVCRITSISKGDPWQKIGIMIRDGYNSGSDYALFCATPNQGVDFQYRLAFNNNPDVAQFVAPSAPATTTSDAIGYGQDGSTSYQLRP